MRKVILYIAMTIDGMIAETNDELSFLEPYDGLSWVEEFNQAMLSRTDTLLMGRRTYDVIKSMGISWPYPDHTCFVYSKDKRSSDHVTFINEDILTHVSKLKELKGKDIWLVGGGKMIQPLLEENLIDEMIVTIIPVILGSGIPLFTSSKSNALFDLIDTKSNSGLVMLTYLKKRT
jgi:dihydrofolate reductase